MSRALALKPDQEQLIWNLWLHRVPQATIAEQIGCSRRTVSTVVNRIRRRLNEQRLQELEELRTEALAEYDAIKLEAWTRLEACAPGSAVAVGYISTIVNARQAQDRLLGLQELTVNLRAVHLAKVENLLDTPVPLVLPGAESDDGEPAPRESNGVRGHDARYPAAQHPG